MKPWEKYGLTEFWYNDLKLTGKKLKKQKIKTVSLDLAASNLREYLAKKLSINGNPGESKEENLTPISKKSEVLSKKKGKL